MKSKYIFLTLFILLLIISLKLIAREKIDIICSPTSSLMNNQLSLPDVIISEYVEGTGYNKAIEITNLSDGVVNLGLLSIKKDQDGNNIFNSSLILNGVLAPGASYVVVNSSASSALLQRADANYSSAVLSFNGNDQLKLCFNGITIDSIGTSGGGNFGKDITLIRSRGINDDYIQNPWMSYPTDYFLHLGIHQNLIPTTGAFFSEYVEGTYDNKALEIFNTSSQTLDMKYFAIQKDQDGNGVFGTAFTLNGLMQSNCVVVVANSASNSALLSKATIQTNASIIQFNGDDQIRLLFQGKEIDRIGVGGNVNFGIRKTLVRNPSILQGVVNSSSMSQWITFGSDDFSHLGWHAVSGLSTYRNPTPSFSENYILETTPQIKIKEDSLTNAMVGGIAITQMGINQGDIVHTINYFDGLGRPLQTIALSNSPDMKDIVTPIGYDALGRESRKYLPYKAGETSGAYHPHELTNLGYSNSEQYQYYQKTVGNANADIPDTDFPYAETVFENSPLNRITKLGAPGEEWQPTSTGVDHAVQIKYGTNLANKVICWGVNNVGTLTKIGYYKAGTLFQTSTLDENGILSQEYKDLHGRIVLKVTAEGTLDSAHIYYVYNNLNQLKYVLSPLFISKMGTTTNFTSDNILLKSLAYFYVYDEKGRIILKQLPGAAPTYMVYDQRDRLVATQDGNQREAGKWIITKYDALNRVVATAEYISNSNQSTMQALANSYTSEASLSEIRDNTKIHGYTERSFPGDIDDNNYLTVTYYDKYEFPGVLDFYYANEMNISGYIDSNGNPKYFDCLTGLVTGSRVKVIGSNIWLTTTNFYDDRYRIIQSRSDLYDGSSGGKEIVSSKFDFSGKLLQTKQRHEFGADATTIGKYFKYDHVGRILRIEQEINGALRTTISELSYNDLGQLKDKKLGGGIQSVDYTYNIRGWLNGINNPDNLAAAANGDTFDDLFAMQLLYTSTLPGLAAQAQFNGNISGIIVNRKNDNTATFTRIGQGFNYDALNRLTASDYGEGSNFATNADAYSEFGITYDPNGNIKTLKRNRGTMVDNLTYTYIPNSNQLQSVADATANALGFKDAAGVDYSYDANGNLTKDNNKGITSILYNLLNLPSVLSKDENNSITYIYSATGAKLCKVAKVNGAISKRYYAGGFEYNNDKVLDLILTEEGVVEVSTVSGTRNYTYEYFLKDHLGNTRVVFDGNGKVMQRTDYYPFGMTSGTPYIGSSDNKYLYNGKEQQQELALDWYDYGARFYDPTLGRWHTLDPSAERDHSYSPYIYCANNPIRFIDPDGRWFDDKNEKRAQKLEKKIDKQIGKLEKQVSKLEKKGKDIGDRKNRIGELKQSKTDIADMRGNEKTEFRYASANSRSNPAGQGNPNADGIGTSVVTLYTGSSTGSILHEGRHGGDIARGTLTEKTYGVQDEVSAYRAQYSWDGSLPYRAADFLTNNPALQSAFQSLGEGVIPITNVNNVNLIDANLVNNIGATKTIKVGKDTYTGFLPLYPPNNIGLKQWNGN